MRIETGHFFTSDLNAARVQLHGAGICPKVFLNGAGIPKTLRMSIGKETAIVHHWPVEGSLCEATALEVEKRTGRKVSYKGESLASFANIFCGVVENTRNSKAIGRHTLQKIMAFPRAEVQSVRVCKN